MAPVNELAIYRWEDAPKELRRPLKKRDYIVCVPKNKRLGPTHFVHRLVDRVEVNRRDGSKLIAGNDRPAGTMN